MGNPLKRVVKERGIEGYNKITNKAINEEFRRKHRIRQLEHEQEKKRALELEKEVERLKHL